MTKTESRYAAILEADRVAGRIQEWMFETVTFRLARKTGWTPDFFVVLLDGTAVFVEVKPANWENIPNQDMSNVKSKIAAEMFPFVFWRAVERTKADGGGFHVSVIEGR